MKLMDFYRPLWKFVIAANMSEEDRYNKGLNLKDLFFEAKKYAKSRHSNFFDDDKEILAKEDLKFIEAQLKSFEIKNTEGRKLVLEMASYIKSFYKNDIFSSTEFMDIFQNDSCESFFIDTLEHLDAIDNKGKIKWGFQAAANAILKTEEYRKNILKPNLKLKDYIKYLNERYDANIKSTSKLSDSGNLEKTAMEYFKNGYQNKA